MNQSKADIQFQENGTTCILLNRLGVLRQFLIIGFTAAALFYILIDFGTMKVDFAGPLDTINPNVDPVESLVRLPGIGPARAIAIVEYRNQHEQGGSVFKKLEDLDAVKGFGPKTLEKITPWIRLDEK